MAKLSNTQIDRLGERLKHGPPTENDLVILDEFRTSFGPAYETVVQRVRELKLEPTGRPAKSTTSVVDKLRRETIRLTQIQDIAGCRIVLPNKQDQDRIVESLQAIFPRASVIDRRVKPQHGYRAVHLVARIGVCIEIQVRTLLQHKWAELSEKLADVLDSSIKYGGGPRFIKTLLARHSSRFAELEDVEYDLHRLREEAAGIAKDLHRIVELDIDAATAVESNVNDLEARVVQLKKQDLETCEDLITWLLTYKDRK